MLLGAIDPGSYTAIVVATAEWVKAKYTVDRYSIRQNVTIYDFGKVAFEVKRTLIEYPDLEKVIIERPPTVNLDKNLRAAWEFILGALKDNYPEEDICITSPGAWKPFAKRLPIQKSEYANFGSQHEKDAFDMLRWYFWTLRGKNGRG